MNNTTTRNRTSWALAVGAALLVLASAGSAQATIEGITGVTTFNFAAGEGEIVIADGGSYEFWGYEDLDGHEGVGLPQYPGPTIIVNQGDYVTINLTSELHDQCTSMVFPGHAVSVTAGTGDQEGQLTRETCPGGTAVQYTFTAEEPGTYMYYSGTNAQLQVEMGLLGVIIVRPGAPFNDGHHAYNDARSRYDHEYLFLLTSMDPYFHTRAEQHQYSAIDYSARWPVYWFINGRTAPDDLGESFVSWAPHQPYNCLPRMRPGESVLVRIIGGDQDQHPLHLHGNHYHEIARYGRMLQTPGGALASRAQFTTLSVPGQTVDAIFTWTGEKLGWDIYGTLQDGQLDHDCNGIALSSCESADPSDSNPACQSAGYDPVTNEYCGDHGKPFPVTLPENQNLAFGGWWSGSPFLGGGEQLPPGEGGLNPNNGFFFMWHSHTEKELTNFDIFPGGMLSMMVVEPPGTPIP
ncbi:MAG TPA: multicopper oxidase domain-containing protein [Thermoanaerobaculales bacterium]|nr:multicopper oxidase domain-containing protein [Thermoanaerobaculales bacterium]HPA79763.1 multicopper oxidase domain-containing protein [Thermoanaerobaculales bacterium]HQN94745.1 multicopper oxidase domain-containing protein [Thermoanaerobaculales bacterium]HQP42374.1 multicopper oxidase domain-containing protein [Thermoanaerobaculales bacterium]